MDCERGKALSDVYGTGYHAAKQAKVTSGDTVAVIGDGAVGLMAVLSAKHHSRTNICCASGPPTPKGAR